MGDHPRKEVVMSRSKQCFKCGAVKRLSEFYEHPRMLDGHVNKCKECNKIDVRENRESKVEQYRAYDRQRSKSKERKDAAAAYQKLWRREDLRRVRCHNAVSHAIRKGALRRLPCEVCGSDLSVAHHDDYDRPLNVRWLCSAHHKAIHDWKLKGAR